MCSAYRQHFQESDQRETQNEKFTETILYASSGFGKSLRNKETDRLALG